MKDIYNGNPYYDDSVTDLKNASPDALLDAQKKAVPEVWSQLNLTTAGTGNSFATLFPYIGVLSNICIDSNDTYKIIRPGESVSIPLSFYYWIGTGSGAPEYVSRSLSFDFRTSLYQDPLCYRLTVNAGNTANVYSKVRRESGFTGSKYTAVVNRTVKTLDESIGTVPSVQVKKRATKTANKGIARR